MKLTSLLRYFMVYAVVLPVSLSIASGLACFLVIPPLAWFFTNQWKWLSFNEWMGYVLLGIPSGIMMAGMMTLILWYEKTDTPLVKKIVISAVVAAIIIGSMYQVVVGINILLPVPSHAS